MDEKETPRGNIENYKVPDERVKRENVELAGATWTVEFNYLTLGEYAAVPIPAGTRRLEHLIAIAQAMAPSLNGETVNMEALTPKLGMELAEYLDRELSRVPGKNC